MADNSNFIRTEAYRTYAVDLEPKVGSIDYGVLNERTRVDSNHSELREVLMAN